MNNSFIAETQAEVAPSTFQTAAETAKAVQEAADAVLVNPYAALVYTGPEGKRRAILFYPDERLRQPSQPVGCFDAELKQLAADLVTTCRATDAAGLSAAQIGVPLRVICVRFLKDEYIVMVNPVIEGNSGDNCKSVVTEGCLSFPSVFEQVERYESIDVSFNDIEGNGHACSLDLETEASRHNLGHGEPTGPACQVVQHEVEHLDGILLIDHLQVHRKMRVKTHMKQVGRKTHTLFVKSSKKLSPTQAVFGYVPEA
jgi:peptide deformylase